MAKNKVNLTEKYRSTAANFLAAHHKHGKIERGFTGIMSPKFGDYVLVMQFGNGALIGCIIVPVENAEPLGKQLQKISETADYAEIASQLEEGDDGIEEN